MDGRTCGARKDKKCGNQSVGRVRRSALIKPIGCQNQPDHPGEPVGWERLHVARFWAYRWNTAPVGAVDPFSWRAPLVGGPLLWGAPSVGGEPLQMADLAGKALRTCDRPQQPSPLLILAHGDTAQTKRLSSYPKVCTLSMFFSLADWISSKRSLPESFPQNQHLFLRIGAPPSKKKERDTGIRYPYAMTLKMRVLLLWEGETRFEQIYNSVFFSFFFCKCGEKSAMNSRIFALCLKDISWVKVAKLIRYLYDNLSSQRRIRKIK